MQQRSFVILACALVAFGPAGLAQLQQTQIDCDSPRNYTDPRCQALMRGAGQGSRESLGMPGIPVIRDPGVMEPLPDTRYDRSRFGEQRLPDARPLPPEEPTEFQKFVEASTGKALPVFGQNLFERVPSTFAPADRVPVTPEYVVGPGDQLLVRGWGQIDLNVSPVVDRSGSVYVPQVGNLNVAGLRFAQVQDYLKAAIGRVYHNFDLSVNMGQLRSIQVFVVGHARRPGGLSGLRYLAALNFAYYGRTVRWNIRGWNPAASTPSDPDPAAAVRVLIPQRS